MSDNNNDTVKAFGAKIIITDNPERDRDIKLCEAVEKLHKQLADDATATEKFFWGSGPTTDFVDSLVYRFTGHTFFISMDMAYEPELPTGQPEPSKLFKLLQSIFNYA